MYAQRMAMDPRFAHPAHIPRHRDPNLSRLPHNFNMQVYRPNYIFLHLIIVLLNLQFLPKDLITVLYFLMMLVEQTNAVVYYVKVKNLNNFSPSIAWLKGITWALGMALIPSINRLRSTPSWVQLMAHLWAHVPWPSSLDLLLKPACTHPPTIQKATTYTPWATDSRSLKDHLSTTIQA